MQAKLSFSIWNFNYGIQKIAGFILEKFGMILIRSQIENKLGKGCFLRSFPSSRHQYKSESRNVFPSISNVEVVFCKKRAYLKDLFCRQGVVS